MTARRLVALDVLRGAAVVAMIIVNNPGNWLAVYPQLQHAAWNGCTLADLVFPLFIVILGVALPFAFDRRARDGAGIARRIAVRSLVLMLLGLVLNAVAAWPHLETMRVPGVLQRIAVTYAAAALLVWRLSPRVQVAIAAALLLVHASLVAAGLGATADRAVFGEHLLAPSGDPEGLIGTVSSIATALVGAVAGAWLLRERGRARTGLGGLVAGGAFAVVAGWAWSAVLPMNKPLWTGSYALFAAGIALLMLALTMFAIARAGDRWSRPFQWLGRHALTIYFGSELIARLLDRPLLQRQASVYSLKDVFFWRWLTPYVHDAGGVRSSLLFGLIYAGLWMAIAALMHRRRSAVHR